MNTRLGLIVTHGILSANLAGGAAQADRAWAALLKPNEIEWPAQPEQVEELGAVWHRVQTKYFQLHFDPAQTDAARELAAIVDNVYDLYARLLEIKPPPRIPGYLSSSKEMHVAVTTAWGFSDWRSRSPVSDPAASSVAARADGVTRGSRIYNLMSAVGCLFAQQKRGRPLPPWPAALAHLWLRQVMVGHCAHRAQDAADSMDTRERIKGRLSPEGPARLRPIIAEMNARARTKWGKSIFWGRALCYYVEKRYGLSKLGEIWRVLGVVPPEQPIPVTETFSKVIGKPFEQIEDECAEFFGVTLTAEPPRPVVQAVATTRVRAFQQARGAIMRRDYTSALNALLAALTAPGGEHSAKEWADLHYAAGFALDQLGHRQRAIDHYERALAWTEPKSSLHAELDQALVQRATRFLYASRSRSTRMPVRNRVVDLFDDERKCAAIAQGGTHPRFPHLLPNNHLDNTPAEDKARLADEQLQILGTAPDGEQRWRAMEILGLLRERRALPLLHKFAVELGTAMGYRQCTVAARALYRIADPSSIPALIKATRCTNLQTRGCAASALQKLTGQRFRRPTEWERWRTAQ